MGRKKRRGSLLSGVSPMTVASGVTSEAAAPPSALTYEGAYIKGSEAGASNKTISLKFTEAVPTGSDYTTGVTIEVTANNGSSYSTLDLGDTTQAVVGTNYVQYTLTGTVDTFQGLSGTDGHQVRISYDGSQSWNTSTITNITPLTNASTINLLDGVVERYGLDSVAAQIGSDLLNSVNNVTFVSGKIGDAANFVEASTQALTRGSRMFTSGDFSILGWLYQENTGEYFVPWFQGSASVGTIYIYVSTANKIIWTVNNSGTVTTWDSAISPDTWYHHACTYDSSGTPAQDLYVNGVHRDGPDAATATFTGDRFSIGAISGLNLHTDGRADEMQFMSRVVTSDEQVDHYNGGDGKQWPFLPDYTSLTYEGAYINRSGETGASNKTISLKFAESVPAGDYTTGMTIEVTADNGSSYETLNLSSTTQAVVDTYYVQYTLTGTVDTFQGLSGTDGHQVRISYDGSQSWNSGTLTNITTLNNASTVNLLDLFTHGYTLTEVSGDRDDVIGSLDLVNVNTVESTTTSIPAGLGGRAADFERDNSERLTLADHVDFDNDNTKYFGWMLWVKLEDVDVTEFILSKQLSGGSGADWTIMYHGDTGSGNDQFKWGLSPAAGPGSEQNNWSDRYDPALADTWYMIAAWFDPTDVGSGSKKSFVNITQEDEAFDAATTDELTITSGNLPAASDSGVEFGSVNGGANFLDGRVSAAYWFKGTSGLSNDEISDFFNGGDGKQWPFIPDHL